MAVQTDRCNVNVVLDISKVSKHYVSRYGAIKNCIHLYVVIMLSRALLRNPAADATVFAMENKSYDKVLIDLVYQVVTEDKLVFSITDGLDDSYRATMSLLDEIHDNVVNITEDAVEAVANNPRRYTDKTVAVDVNLINQHTVIISLKTLKKGSL
jgi:hypothetical protein